MLVFENIQEFKSMVKQVMAEDMVSCHSFRARIISIAGTVFTIQPLSTDLPTMTAIGILGGFDYTVVAIGREVWCCFDDSMNAIIMGPVLGSYASDYIPLGSILISFFASQKLAFDTHTHVVASFANPSAIPVPSFPLTPTVETISSKLVKVKTPV
jgi:hypothetical protein